MIPAVETRRGFLVQSLAGTLGAGILAGSSAVQAQAPAADGTKPSEPEAFIEFPRQPAKLVEETVGASHGRFERVRELVTAYPELAKSNWDWGYGDWESPLEAASHTGQREIAMFLMEHGARPSVFTHAMLGELEIVQAILKSRPELVKTGGPHGLTLLHHARVGGDRAASVLAFLQGLSAPDNAPGVTSKELAEQLPGEYATSDGRLRLLVAKGLQGLSAKANGGIARNLIPLADGTMHPAGAPSVRLRFEPVGAAAQSLVLTVGGKKFEAVRVQ